MVLKKPFDVFCTTHFSVAAVHAPLIIVPVTVTWIKPRIPPHVGTGEGLHQRGMAKSRGKLCIVIAISNAVVSNKKHSFFVSNNQFF